MNRAIERPIMIELVFQMDQFAWRISMLRPDGRRRATCYPAGVDLLAVRSRLSEAVARWRETRKRAAAVAKPRARPPRCAVVGCPHSISGPRFLYCWEHGTRELF